MTDRRYVTSYYHPCSALPPVHHFYCYLTGGTAYLLDRESEWCYSEMLNCILCVTVLGESWDNIKKKIFSGLLSWGKNFQPVGQEKKDQQVCQKINTKDM